MAVTAGNGGAGHGNRWRVAIWGLAALMLLTPLVAMQFTPEVRWGGGDFIVFGTMLVIACCTFELAARMTGSGSYRAAAGVAIATAFLLVWAGLAVGVIGDEGNPLNLMFGGVLAIGVIGCVATRFQPGGMAGVLALMACTHALAAAIGGFSDRASLAPNAVFVALWLVSAGLFRKAARKPG
jgi:hypothetical protein